MSELTHTVYEIFNQFNGKRYIGVTSNYDKRIYSHKRGLKAGEHRIKAMQDDYAKHGPSSVVFVPIESCAKEESLGRESYWILRFRSNHPDFGYNTDADAKPIVRAFEHKPKLIQIPLPIGDVKVVSLNLDKSNRRAANRIVRVGGVPTEKALAEIVKLADEAYADYCQALLLGAKNPDFLKIYDRKREQVATPKAA